jgi:transposase
MTGKENIVKLIGKARSKSMRKNILALAPGQLYNILEYKCTKRELYFQKVDPAQSEQAFACKKEYKSSNRMQQALLVKKLVVLVELLNKH